MKKSYKSKDLYETVNFNSNCSEKETEYCFWEDKLYLKLRSCKFFEKFSFKYLDHGPSFYAFFRWVSDWIHLVSKQYVEPYKFYPLPISDQILRWQPIFSKHVSDALVRLDQYATAKSQSVKRPKKPYKTILMRALFKTFWKRLGFIVVCFAGLCSSNLSLIFLVRKILILLTNEKDRLIYIFTLVLILSFLQFFVAILLDHMNFYMYRLIHVIQYSFSITIFQHGLVYRRRFSNEINGSNPLKVCNQLLHTCSPDSECSKNPLFCQALRYQNRDLSSRIFSFEFMDSYYISLFIESVVYIFQFVFNFLVGFYVIYECTSVSVWQLYACYFSALFLMIVVEILNTVILKYIYGLKDYRINKSREIISGLDLINKMCMDDIAHDAITQTRNNELMLLFLRFVLSFFNRLLINISSSYAIVHVLDDTIDMAFRMNDVTKFRTSHLMSSMIALLKIDDCMYFVPDSIKFLTYSLISYFRAEYYMRECSPNFYISDNKYTGVVETSSHIVDATNQIPKDVIVYYKDATFTWVNSREDLLDKNYEPYLKNINFELKRGEMVIVLGAQGAGKSNFIKSMLGEMTLVGGSMAVVPLYTSMPIFYASQDIWLQHGTIRSNIVFGHKFEEDLYNAVLKAVELEFDISTWEMGDMRVVSDNAHSLSGGQRVRMEMARAVYAYLVFHKVNEQYNNSKCSFLMCLDSSFHGLDPYVSKTIFNNLFNQKTGLLMKGDLSVVLTSTRTTLDICLKSLNVDEMRNISIFEVKNQNLTFYQLLHDFINNKKKYKDDYAYLPSSVNGQRKLDYLSDELLALSSSGCNTRLGRIEATKALYSKVFGSKDNIRFSKVTFNTYYIYMKPALALFIFYIIINISLTVLDNAKLVLSTNLSDYITKNINSFKDGGSVDLGDIKSRSTSSLKIVLIMVILIVSVSVFSVIIVVTACMIASRKVHEYVISSIFKNPSSVIKVRKEISQIVTYLSSDTMLIDDGIGVFLCLVLSFLIQTLINLVTLSILIPLSIPFLVLGVILVYFGVLKKFLDSSRNVHLAYLETTSKVNLVCENAISGTSIYRSFKKEFEMVTNTYEQADYKTRTRYMFRSFLIWSNVLFNWIFSATTLAILSLLITLDKFTNYKLKVGYFGLGLSLCMSITRSFSRFSASYTLLDMYFCSIRRFESFIPPGQKVKFDKFLNSHEEFIVNPMNKTITDADRKQLFKRRSIEFRSDNRRFYLLRRLFFHPRITVLDVGRYLSSEHSGVELNDVCVFTSPDHNPDGMILKHLTVSAHKSEIIGIIGRTGAGKTTLLSVLQNIVAHRTGQVLLDTKDLNDIPKTVLRQIIGVLPQLPFVFKGWTIRRFLDPRKLFTDDDINRALDQCGLLRFVNELPGGKKLDAVMVPENLGLDILKSNSHNKHHSPKNKNKTSPDLTNPFYESDMLLTNSQLRTLWLAKLVLYKHFYRMIIVDEPPEEDAFEEAENDDLGVPIYELVQKHFTHCTTFLTAHDANVLKSCTNVWVVHDGRLIRTCKTSDIAANESIANIIEESVKYAK